MIVGLYKELIVPFWEKRSSKIKFDPNLAAKVRETRYDFEARKLLRKKLVRCDSWSKNMQAARNHF